MKKFLIFCEFLKYFFFSRFLCRHEFEILEHFNKGKFSPFYLTKCKHCQRREKIDEYENQDWWDDDYSVIHPIIKTWIRGKISLEEASGILRRDLANAGKEIW